MKTSEQSTHSVKSKVLAALAMLLVAIVMLVSSTYAWFTLSTAPEVEGVSTAVGANGSLEMLLATKDASGQWVYDTGEVGTLTEQYMRNTYWGNLVDLSHESYGSQAITLLPSKLNLNTDGKFQPGAPLEIPEYDKDGRVLRTKPAGQFATFNGTNFITNTGDYGFRGLGVASGLSDRQQAFRTAAAAMSAAAYNAQTAARNSLSANGTALARIAIAKAMNTTEFTSDDVAAINDMITGLEASLKQVETAYVQAIKLYVLGTSIDHATDEVATVAATAIDNAANGAGDALNAKLTAVLAIPEVPSGATSQLTGYATYEAAINAVTTAKAAKLDETSKTEFTWAEISPSLSAIVNMDNITINGIAAGSLNDTNNKNQIASDILGGKGVKVNMPTGGGVYADVADLAGDYTVDITIDSTDLNAGVDGLAIKASMTADSTQATPYLTTVNTALTNASLQPAKAGDGDLPLTEVYGYVIDLAFRTNAAQSNLLLKTEATDRIYDGNANTETMGAGSSMTFKSNSPDFTTDQVKALMSRIRVVFYSTDDGATMSDVYATAALDTANATIDANGITAKLYITENKIDTADSDDAITSLNQNEIKHISALVYLDGESIQNSEVAATVAASMTGTVNLQFASSATLDPMEYGELHQ